MQAVLDLCEKLRRDPEVPVTGAKINPRLVRSVEVGAAGEEKIIFLCKSDDFLSLLLRVVVVVGLDPAKTRCLEALYQCVQSLISQVVLEGVGEDREAVELLCKGDCLFRGDLFPRHKVRAVLADVLLKGLADFLHVPVLFHVPSKVRPGKDRAREGSLDLFIGHVKARLAEKSGHLFVAVYALVYKLLALFAEGGILPVEVQAHDVHVDAVVLGGEFNPRNDLKVRALCRIHRLLNARDVVVIGQGDRGQVLFQGKLHQLCRRQGAVGLCGMAVKINEGGTHPSSSSSLSVSEDRSAT